MGANVDPRYVTLATRLRGLRTDLDRLDDQLDLFDREQRVEFAQYTTRIRGEVDGLEDALGQRAAHQP